MHRKNTNILLNPLADSLHHWSSFCCHLRVSQWPCFDWRIVLTLSLGLLQTHSGFTFYYFNRTPNIIFYLLLSASRIFSCQLFSQSTSTFTLFMYYSSASIEPHLHFSVHLFLSFPIYLTNFLLPLCNVCKFSSAGSIHTHFHLEIQSSRVNYFASLPDKQRRQS